MPYVLREVGITSILKDRDIRGGISSAKCPDFVGEVDPLNTWPLPRDSVFTKHTSFRTNSWILWEALPTCNTTTVSNSFISCTDGFLTGVKLWKEVRDLIVSRVMIGKWLPVLKLYFLRRIELCVPPGLRLLRSKTVVLCIVDLAIRDVESLPNRSPRYLEKEGSLDL